MEILIFSFYWQRTTDERISDNIAFFFKRLITKNAYNWYISADLKAITMPFGRYKQGDAFLNPKKKAI